MRNYSLAGILLFALATVASADLAESFPKGEGMRYILETSGVQSDMSIVVASSSSQKVNVEMYMHTEQANKPIQLWQQFELVQSGRGPASLTRGYVYAPELKKPEILPQSQLRESGDGGLKLESFLIASETELKKYEVNSETLDTAAGKVKATHYRQVAGDQTVDYWIAPLRPFGLVKLESKGKKPEENYSLRLTALVKNAVAKIDPINAQQLSAKGREILGITK